MDSQRLRDDLVGGDTPIVRFSGNPSGHVVRNSNVQVGHLYSLPADRRPIRPHCGAGGGVEFSQLGDGSIARPSRACCDSPPFANVWITL